MANLNADAQGFWTKITSEVPSFLYGFFLGLLSGLAANWITHKVIDYYRRHKGTHLSFEMAGDGSTYFTGRMDGTNNLQILEMMKAAAKNPSKTRKGGKYIPNAGAVKTGT